MEDAGLLELFREGGWTMWLIVLFALGALSAAMAALMANHRGLAMASLGLVALIALAGVGGTMLGRRQVDEAIVVVDPKDQALIREVGYRESGRNLQLAGITGLPLMVLAVAAYVRALQRSA